MAVERLGGEGQREPPFRIRKRFAGDHSREHLGGAEHECLSLEASPGVIVDQARVLQVGIERERLGRGVAWPGVGPVRGQDGAAQRRDQLAGGVRVADTGS